MIRIYPEAEALRLAAAELFAAEARQAVQAHGSITIALAGGSTPRRTYELFIIGRYFVRRNPYSSRI